jgi:predicted GNAT family acetyltransferase
MKVILVPDASTFLTRSASFRSVQPYLTNVMGSVATSVAGGYGTYETMSWWIIEDDERNVRGMMMRTAPHKLVLSPMPNEALVPAVDAVLERDPEIPGVSGSRDLAQSFLTRFIQVSGRALRVEVERAILVYVLGTLVDPAPSGGYWRTGEQDDFELLLTWWNGFADDTDVERHGLEESVRTALSDGRIYLWIDADRPVCAVAHSLVVATPSGSVVRIGPVYTPPAERRRGYAGRLTAAVSSRLLQRGHGLILFTDAANKTSNGVYTRLGYQKVDELVECALLPV